MKTQSIQYALEGNTYFDCLLSKIQLNDSQLICKICTNTQAIFKLIPFFNSLSTLHPKSIQNQKLNCYSFNINRQKVVVMQVDLIPKTQEKTLTDQTVRSKDKRPPNINVEKLMPPGQRWRECKIIGKNVSIRSYGAACAFKNRLYLYGGYQILMGGLRDFYSINLDETEPTFNWEQIITKTEIYPGSRSKHALVSTTTRIYLIGGLFNNDASSDIYQFDPETSIWRCITPEGFQLPPIQSFGAVTVNIGGEDRIIIAFGFNQQTASPSNAVYQYNIPKNKLSILFEGSASGSKDIPHPRTGCAITSDNTNVYIFGGKNQFSRLNDLWSFSLTDFKFTRLSDQGQIPAVRNGHSMNYFDGKLYVFGGIHDITWELDDLHIYGLKNKKWITLEQDSPRKIDKKGNTNTLEDKNQKNNNNKKKGYYENMGNSAMMHRASSPISNKNNYSFTLMEEGRKNDSSPGKMLEEQKKKMFMYKKAEMLKNFDVSKEQKSKYIALQTSSQAMKISLDVIGNPDPKIKIPEDRLTDFGKESTSKFLGPLQNHTNVVVGKKPCARDGHCAVVMGQNLVIFGGDRHQMSFNDIYKLDLSIAGKNVETN